MMCNLVRKETILFNYRKIYECISNTYDLYGIVTFLMGVLEPTSSCRNTNSIYSTEGVSHFVTIWGGTGIPETVLKAFPPLWS